MAYLPFTLVPIVSDIRVPLVLEHFILLVLIELHFLKSPLVLELYSGDLSINLLSDDPFNLLVYFIGLNESRLIVLLETVISELGEDFNESENVYGRLVGTLYAAQNRQYAIEFVSLRGRINIR